MADELVEALRRRGVTEVDATDRRRAEYASDASLYRVRPRAVAFPRTADEVIAAVDACRELGVPVTARGAGTSIAGNAVGAGLVLDNSRHLTRVLEVRPEERLAVVSPGVVLADLQRAARPHGLRFGPDPSTHNRASIGGTIGNNACGSRALAFGRTSDNLLAADVLFGTGERATLTDDRSCLSGSRTLRRLADVVAADLSTVRTEFGRFSRQGSGYALEHLLPERMAPARAFAGSEGTWGQLLTATVRLVPQAPATALLVIGYPSMADAADAAPGLLAFGPIAVEGLDRRIVDVVRTTHGAAAIPDLPAGAGWLMVEVGADTRVEAVAVAERLLPVAGGTGHVLLTDPGPVAAAWRIREDGAGLAARPHGGWFAYPGFEDAAVPVASLGEYLRRFDDLLTGYGLHGAPYGHFGDGCVHVRIDFGLSDPDGRRRYVAFVEAAARLVASFGGSMSGEHGDGRARSALLPIMYSPAALDLFARAKRVADPAGLLNPGVLVDPAPVDAAVRTARPVVLSPSLGLSYPGDADRFDYAVARCTGVGKCRADTTATGGVMCPSYLATRDEKDSTRARARVLQDVIAGDLPGGFRSPAVAESLDLCLACKGCTNECPTGVDMAAYKAEVLYQRYRHRLRPRTHYTLGRLPSLVRLAAGRGGWTRVLNGALRTPLRRLAGPVAGLDHSRGLPKFATRTFSARPGTALEAGTPRPAGRVGTTVAVWADTMTEYLRPGPGQAVLAVLAAAGLSPVVVGGRDDRACCGLPQFSTGQLDLARRLLERTAAVLDPLLEQGIPVVGVEPSCLAMLRGDAERLIGRTLAVSTLAEALEQHAPGWEPPDLRDTAVLVQPHCHHRAVMGFQADERLLARAGASVTSVGGCCGLAGDFGMSAGKAGVSRAVAEVALLPALRNRPAGAVVLADGYSCSLQIDDVAGVEAVSLPELLASRLGVRTG